MAERKQEAVEINRFRIDDVLTKAELDKMSKKNMHKHIEYLEQTALSLDHGLTIAIDQINKKIRGLDGHLH